MDHLVALRMECRDEACLYKEKMMNAAAATEMLFHFQNERHVSLDHRGSSPVSLEGWSNHVDRRIFAAGHDRPDLRGFLVAGLAGDEIEVRG